MVDFFFNNIPHQTCLLFSDMDSQAYGYFPVFILPRLWLDIREKKISCLCKNDLRGDEMKK